MKAVRMTLSYGACCATAELRSFAHYDDNWFGDHPWREKRTLATLDPYNHKSLEAQGFSRSGDHFYGTGDTFTQAWQNCLKAVQESVDGYSYKGVQVRYFWFVQYRDGDGTYQHNELRELVMNTEGVVKLGAYVNANSSNTVDGYMMVFNNANGVDPEKEEDEDDDE